ncbi:hypothetical protein AFX72_00358 [Listeria monocytogenes]|nr:hypothetical protein DYZ61_02332 [Listeria monocytogenes]RKA68137.1 hypothetical protein AFX74_00452 [Listeria monocytogenes]RKA73850.1 hypothetical protein AFX68_00478 [Listeria monocytogenes]RKB29447.1 hypothetical protein AFX72_00358 [Listeria monocytogenes]RKB61043.1 hypothetical protein HL29_01999 [Listeria monocytogenes]
MEKLRYVLVGIEYFEILDNLINYEAIYIISNITMNGGILVSLLVIMQKKVIFL